MRLPTLTVRSFMRRHSKSMTHVPACWARCERRRPPPPAAATPSPADLTRAATAAHPTSVPQTYAAAALVVIAVLNRLPIKLLPGQRGTGRRHATAQTQVCACCCCGRCEAAAPVRAAVASCANCAQALHNVHNVLR